MAAKVTAVRRSRCHGDISCTWLDGLRRNVRESRGRAVHSHHAAAAVACHVSRDSTGKANWTIVRRAPRVSKLGPRTYRRTHRSGRLDEGGALVRWSCCDGSVGSSPSVRKGWRIGHRHVVYGFGIGKGCGGWGLRHFVGNRHRMNRGFDCRATGRASATCC